MLPEKLRKIELEPRSIAKAHFKSFCIYFELFCQIPKMFGKLIFAMTHSRNQDDRKSVNIRAAHISKSLFLKNFRKF